MKYKIIDSTDWGIISEINLETRPRITEKLLIEDTLYSIENIIHNDRMPRLEVKKTEKPKEFILETE